MHIKFALNLVRLFMNHDMFVCYDIYDTKKREKPADTRINTKKKKH